MDTEFPLPPDEAERLVELTSCRLIERPNQKSLALLVELAAAVMGVPVALVSLIDAQTQWMKAIHGADVPQMPRSTSFCTYVLLQDEPVVVLDAHQDPRFSANPLVLEQPKIRFYAGVPLLGPRGHALGSFCLIDHEPHPAFTDREKRLLRKFGDIAAEILLEDMRRVALAR
jgi:GAF domain-containing protein